MNFKFNAVDSSFENAVEAFGGGLTDDEADRLVAWARLQTERAIEQGQITWRLYGHWRPEGNGNDFLIQFDNCFDRASLFKLTFGGNL